MFVYKIELDVSTTTHKAESFLFLSFQLWGPSIKYVTLLFANFYPLPLSHFVTHPKTPWKVRHTSRTPPIFSRPCTKIPDKSPLYKFYLNCPQRFLSGDFVRVGFCPFPLLSRYICYNRKLNITLNSMFHMYDKNLYKRDVTCSLSPLPLSQTVTPSRTPSPLERDVLYGRPLSVLSQL